MKFSKNRRSRCDGSQLEGKTPGAQQAPEESSFQAATDLRRSFRVEVEELKEKDEVSQVPRVGHWSRNVHSDHSPRGLLRRWDRSLLRNHRKWELRWCCTQQAISTTVTVVVQQIQCLVGSHEATCSRGAGTTAVRTAFGLVAGIRGFGLRVRPHHYWQSNVGWNSNRCGKIAT